MWNSKILLPKNDIKYLCTTELQGPQFLSYTDCRATIYIKGPGPAPYPCSCSLPQLLLPNPASASYPVMQKPCQPGWWAIAIFGHFWPFLAIFGHFWPLFGHYLAIIDHYWPLLATRWSGYSKHSESPFLPQLHAPAPCSPCSSSCPCPNVHAPAPLPLLLKLPVPTPCPLSRAHACSCSGIWQTLESMWLWM